MTKKKVEVEKSIDAELLSLLKKFAWQDIVLVVAVVTVFLLQLSTVTSFNQLPGPVYGGDIYREKGFSLHILNGNSLISDPYHMGEYAFYPQFGYMLAAGAAKITGMPMETTLIYFPLLTFLLIAFGGFKLGRAMFDDKTSQMLFAITVIMAETFIHYKHPYALGYGAALMFFSYFVTLLKEKPTLKKKIVCGLWLGVVSVSHYKPFIYTVSIVLSFVVLELIYHAIKHKNALGRFKELFLIYWIPASIGFVISLFFFGPIILAYKMKTLNLTNQFSLFDPSKNGVEWVFKLIRKTFVNFGHFKKGVMGAFTALGVIYTAMNFKNVRSRFALFALVGVFGAAAHYLITIPLFDNYVVPSHVAGGLIIPKFLLFVLGGRLLISSLKKYKASEYIVVAIMIGLVILPFFLMHKENNENNQWVKAAQSTNPGTQLLFQIGSWFADNVAEDEVVLAHDESSFMINGLSGRKVVHVRRTHASPYVDVDKRYADAMVMLYGTNKDVREQLYDEYNVKYIFLDNYLSSSPMFTHPRFEEYLTENGVQYTMQKVRLDPASPEAPYYDYLVIGAQNITAEDSFSALNGFQAGAQIHSVVYQRNAQ